MKSNAVILEAGTVSRGDVDFNAIREVCGELDEYDFTPYDKIVEYVGEHEIVLCNKTPFTADIIKKCKNLKYIGLCATGFNNIDTEAAKSRGITVTNVPGYATAAVAETVFAFISEFAKRTSKYVDFVNDGGWIRAKSFAEFVFPITELHGKTIGIIGYGAIGRAVGKIAEAFEMNVLVSTRTPTDGVKNVTLDEIFSCSDYITLHCPLTPQTENLVNEKRLSLCKKNAVIINTSRGKTVDEFALVNALKTGKIAGAGLDVLTVEPMSEKSPIWELINDKNFPKNKLLISPHVAWAPIEARIRLLEIVTENLRNYKNNTPINVVNP
jgi:glycerate dehydrogenase